MDGEISDYAIGNRGPGRNGSMSVTGMLNQQFSGIDNAIAFIDLPVFQT
jgi:hypothetical protein